MLKLINNPSVLGKSEHLFEKHLFFPTILRWVTPNLQDKHELIFKHILFSLFLSYINL